MGQFADQSFEGCAKSSVGYDRRKVGSVTAGD